MTAKSSSGSSPSRSVGLRVKSLNAKTGQWSTRSTTAGRPTQAKEQPGPYRGVPKEK